MNYEKRFCEIRDFLIKHEYLHELEMLDRFESKIIEPYNSWFDEVNKLSDEQLIQFESNKDTNHINDERLIQFINIVKDLIKIPVIKTEEFKLEQVYKRKMNAKKIHEIQTLKSFVDQNVSVNSFIDVGSGAGHLSQALVSDNDKTSICIDMSSDFQKIGIEKINRWLPSLKDKITFKQLEIKENTKNQFDQESMILGLHSCGPLSTYLIQSIPEYILNFGCCYHKLVDEYNISTLAKEKPIFFTNHALTMAAKGSGLYSSNELEQKFKVKRFRYTLHFLCLEKFSIPFATLGNATKSDYEGKFSDYAIKYLPQVKVLSTEELDTYYDSNSEKIDKIIRAGSIRSQLARLIEIYLLLDRCIYLREKSINANMFELFDKNISPRNIAIFSSGKIV